MDEMQGVMALPEAQGAGMRPEDRAIFEQIRQTIPRQEITKEFLAAGEQADPQAVAEFKQELAGLQLTPDELNKLNTMVDAILAAPQDYASLRRAYLAEGMSEDLLPEQFDPAFFAALNMALDTIAMNPGSPPPMAMARGGVADLAAYGRNGDTMLAHITPQEAAMLKRMGGSGTINPYTGLPEYASIFKKIGNAVKKFAKSTAGKILIGAGLAIFAGPAAAAWLSSTAGAAGLTGVAGFLSSAAGSAAVGGFLAGAGTTLASGGGFKNALRNGILGGVTGAAMAGITGGADAFSARPGVVGNTLTGNPSLAQPAGFDYASGAPLSPELAPGASLAQTAPVEVGAPLAPRPDAVAEIGAKGGQPIGGPVRVSQPIDAQFQFANRAGTLSASMDFPPAPMSGDTLTAVDRAIPAQPMVPRAPIERAPSLYQTAIDVPPGQSFPPSTGAVGQAPSGGGVMDTLREGYGKVENFYDKYISPDRYAGSPDVIAKQSAAADMARARASQLNLSAAATDRLVEKAIADATPGMLTRYAPLAALGVGALGLMGGFKAKDAKPPDMALFSGPSAQQRAAARLYYGGIRPTSYGSMYLPGGYAEGGGVMDTPQAMRVGGKTYPRKVGSINGPGTGTSDSIPAMLSDGEFVFTAKAVRAMGQGSRRKGAKKMYKLMKMLEGKAA
jgi:hypothetical protein